MPETTTNGTDNRDAQIALMSHILERRVLGDLAGEQFGGERDIMEAAGYQEDPGFKDYWSRYQRQDIAGRIVDMPAMTTWRNPPDVVEPETESSEFEEAWQLLVDRLRLYHRFERVDRMAGIGEYAVLLIGTAGDEPLDMPLQEGSLDGPQDVIYTSEFMQIHANIHRRVDDRSDPRYSLPEVYKIDFGGDIEGFQGGGEEEVHWSRVLHVAEDPMGSDLAKGTPRLERVLNDLYDLQKIRAGSSEGFYQFAKPILKAVTDENTSLPEGDDLDDLEDDLLELWHNIRNHWMAEGIDLEQISGEAVDPEAAADLVMTLIAAARGIPKRILFGSERGELASSQDQRNWFGTISERHDRFAEPVMIRPFVDRLIMAGALPTPSDGYEVRWPELFEESDEEKAEVDSQRAEAAASLTPVGGDPMERVRITDEGRVELEPTEGEE